MGRMILEITILTAEGSTGRQTIESHTVSVCGNAPRGKVDRRFTPSFFSERPFGSPFADRDLSDVPRAHCLTTYEQTAAIPG